MADCITSSGQQLRPCCSHHNTYDAQSCRKQIVLYYSHCKFCTHFFMFVFRFFPSPGLMSPVSCVKVLYEVFHPHNTMFSLSTITPHFFPPTLIQSVLVVG